MTTDRTKKLERLAEIISDYRKGEIEVRNPKIINSWLHQFPECSQMQILEALTDIMQRTYISKDSFKKFLKGLAENDKVSSGKPTKEYWKQANILQIQLGGNSQREIVRLFDEVLQETHGYSLDETGNEKGDCIYLDDCIGTGSRVRSDICNWLQNHAPDDIKLHIITPILYKGSFWIDKKIREAADANSKKIEFYKWRLDDFEMENRLRYKDTSDVLWPIEIPSDSSVEAYVNHLNSKGRNVTLRNSIGRQSSKIFANEDQRRLLEREFLIRGCQIKQNHLKLPPNARPLGYHNLDCLGFGSMFITYRNCPNNCPLVFWVEQNEYPALFPRKTNADTSIQNMADDFDDEDFRL